MNNDASNSQSDSSKTIPAANNSELTSTVFDGIKTHLRAFCLGALGFYLRRLFQFGKFTLCKPRTL